MIYSLTLNPSLDYIIGVKDLKTGGTNRAESERITVGGKGVNVSKVLRNLGVSVKDILLTGGFVGEEIKRLLNSEGADAHFITGEGCNRINIKIKSREETELNGIGIPVNEKATSELLSLIEQMSEKDILVISGSVAKGSPTDVYAKLLAKAKSKGIFVTLDASGELFSSAVKYAPDIVKPNLDELCGYIGKELKAENEIIAAAKKLQADGAKSVIVSLGAEGAYILTTTGEVYKTEPPAGKLVNSTGAGDSMIAAYIFAKLSGYSEKERFRYASAAGSACAFIEGFPSRKEIESILTSQLFSSILK